VNKNGNQQILFTALDREVLEKLRDADLDQLKPLDALIFSPSSKNRSRNMNQAQLPVFVRLKIAGT